MGNYQYYFQSLFYIRFNLRWVRMNEWCWEIDVCPSSGCCELTGVQFPERSECEFQSFGKSLLAEGCGSIQTQMSTSAIDRVSIHLFTARLVQMQSFNIQVNFPGMISSNASSVSMAITDLGVFAIEIRSIFCRMSSSFRKIFHVFSSQPISWLAEQVALFTSPNCSNIGIICL